MYLGMVLGVFGYAVLLLERAHVRREEAALAARFGADWEDCRGRTARWI